MICFDLHFAAARAFFCLATKEAKMPGAWLLGDLLVFDG